MLGLVFLLAITPAALGHLIRRLLKPDFSGFTAFYFVLGFLAMVAQFALICYPAIWKDIPFHTVVTIAAVLYGAECLLALLLWGIPRLRGHRAERTDDGLRERLRSLVRSPWFWVMVVICGMQIVRLLFFQTYEPRDSKTYNALMTDIWGTDHLFRSLPGNGHIVESALELRLKYIMSPWYAFLPAIAKIAGLHPLIVANTVMPPYIVLLYYVLIYSIGTFLFPRDKNAVSMMTGVCAILNEFTLNINLQAQILLLWPAWGKSALSRLVIPALLLLYILYASEKYRLSAAGAICAGLICSLAGCAMSTMVILAVPLELGLLSLVWAIRKRSWLPIATGLLMCMPALIYTVVYYLLR